MFTTLPECWRQRDRADRWGVKPTSGRHAALDGYHPAQERPQIFETRSPECRPAAESPVP
nr:hypothetical protein JVH1_9243 [Rhodococcus sp. JVH1]